MFASCLDKGDKCCVWVDVLGGSYDRDNNSQLPSLLSMVGYLSLCFSYGVFHLCLLYFDVKYF